MSISSLNNDFSQIIRESRIEKTKEQQDTTDHAIFVNIFQNAFGVTDATILKRDLDSTDFGQDFFAISKQRINEVIEKKHKLDSTYKLLDFIKLYLETKFNQKIEKNLLFLIRVKVLYFKDFLVSSFPMKNFGPLKNKSINCTEIIPRRLENWMIFFLNILQ